MTFLLAIFGLAVFILIGKYEKKNWEFAWNQINEKVEKDRKKIGWGVNICQYTTNYPWYCLNYHNENLKKNYGYSK